MVVRSWQSLPTAGPDVSVELAQQEILVVHFRPTGHPGCVDIVQVRDVRSIFRNIL